MGDWHVVLLLDTEFRSKGTRLQHNGDGGQTCPRLLLGTFGKITMTSVVIGQVQIVPSTRCL